MMTVMTDTDVRRELAQAKADLRGMESENQALRQIIDDSYPGKMPWDLRKVARQRRALDQLNRKVLTQRFVLRTLEELGRGLTRQEYLSAKATVEDAQLRDRIENPTE
jgi:hypothetical protein